MSKLEKSYYKNLNNNLALLSNDNALLDLPYDTEIVESDHTVSATIEGRRIFDVAFLVEQLKTFGHHSEGLFGCSGKNMSFQKEIRRGSCFELVFKCDMCHKVEKLFSEPKDGYGCQHSHCELPVVKFVSVLIHFNIVSRY
jgi:hypothetical protein